LIWFAQRRREECTAAATETLASCDSSLPATSTTSEPTTFAYRYGSYFDDWLFTFMSDISNVNILEKVNWQFDKMENIFAPSITLL